ncbi:MAG: TPM domain-containing protein [Thermomicrobiales bacterium]
MPVASWLSLQAEEFPERNPNRPGAVYDTVDILTSAQEKAIQNDIDRASGLGIEMLVYTRMSDESATESQVFADRLNAEWNVESSEEANDGLVYLITVNPLDPNTNSVVISAGESVLPIRQLDQDALQRILETDVMPAAADGEFNSAIQFGIRRVLNAVEYSPPDPEPLTSFQASLHTYANVLGAALLQFTVLGFFVVTIVRERRFTITPAPSSMAIYAGCLAVASIAVGIIAIAGRNAFGSLTALATLVVASCVIPLLIGLQSSGEQRARKIRVTERTARNARVIGSAHG